MNLTAEDRKALQGAINVLAEILQQSPEVPDIIEQWPEDDRHLWGEFWQNRSGLIWKYDGWGWVMWQPCWKKWDKETWGDEPKEPPFTRITDPSLPRTWDTLYDVPEDVDRAIGDYLRASRELARSPLSESGWFERVLDGPFRWWAELPAAEVRNITNIREEQ